MKNALIYGILIFASFACKKQEPTQPINTDSNQKSVGCATCPSTFFSFETATTYTTICDDFTDLTNWPSDNFEEEQLVGYSQEETEPIIVGAGGNCAVNSGEEGFYIFGPLNFAFDGNEQEVRFNIYGIYVQYSEMAFSVNGSAIEYMDAEFPIVLDGITIELDTSITDISAFWENSHLTFTGVINEITIIGFESGITELCVTKPVETPLIDNTGPVHFEPFLGYSSEELGLFPTKKTPYGYYGTEGINLSVDFSAFLAYAPTKLSFVHAYLEGESNLINAQLPNTPLIVTIPDSLNYYLNPYGYDVTVFHQPDGVLWTDIESEPIAGAIVDSILITGENIYQIKLGAYLQNSELRSVCSYYEK